MVIFFLKKKKNTCVSENALQAIHSIPEQLAVKK